MTASPALTLPPSRAATAAYRGGEMRTLAAVRSDGARTAAVRVRPVSLPPILPSSIGSHAVELEPCTQPSGAALDVRLPRALDRAVPQRAATFIAGRFCAAQAMRRMDAGASSDVGVAADRSPVWPAGFVGSISHTGRIAVAAAASRARWRGIGIDCERVLSRDAAAEIAPTVLGPEEADVLANALAWLSPAEVVTLAFSAKESVYKCLHPIVGVFFEFHDVRVVAVDAPGATVRLQLVTPLTPEFRPPFVMDVRFAIEADHVWTAALLAADRMEALA